MDEMLQEIKNAEIRANTIIEESEKSKEVAIKNAHSEAKDFEFNEIDNYRKELEKKFLEEENIIKNEGESIIENGNKNASIIMKKAESKEDDALNLLLEKFKNTVD